MTRRSVTSGRDGIDTLPQRDSIDPTSGCARMATRYSRLYAYYCMRYLKTRLKFVYLRRGACNIPFVTSDENFPHAQSVIFVNCFRHHVKSW